MELKEITSQAQYNIYLAEATRLISLDPRPQTKEGKKLTALADLLEAYEKKVMESQKRNLMISREELSFIHEALVESVQAYDIGEDVENALSACETSDQYLNFLNSKEAKEITTQEFSYSVLRLVEKMVEESK